MAVQITLDFTDAQWELMKVHLKLPNVENTHVVPADEAECKAGLEKVVRNQVERSILDIAIDSASTTSQNSFDV